MDFKDEISGGGDTEIEDAAIPHRQPNGEPPVPPVQIPGPDIATNADPSAPAGAIVTPEDLRDLLEAPSDAALVIEEGQARVVGQAAAGDALPILNHEDLTTMLDGPGADHADETLQQLAAGLDNAVRQQGG